jgi:hypothetical protein
LYATAANIFDFTETQFTTCAPIPFSQLEPTLPHTDSSDAYLSTALGLQLARMGRKFLDDWCRQVMRSRIEPMKSIARSLSHHRELILNDSALRSCFPAELSRV